MANPTFETYGTKGIREDLADIIYNIAPTDTPFMSNVGKGSASGHAWCNSVLVDILSLTLRG